MTTTLLLLGAALALTVGVVGTLFFISRKHELDVSNGQLAQVAPKSNEKTSAPLSGMFGRNKQAEGDAIPSEGKYKDLKIKTAAYVPRSRMGKIFIKTQKRMPAIESDKGEPLTFTDLNSHVLVLGQSGTGKTRRFLTQIMLNYFEAHHIPPSPERDRLKFAGFFLDPKAEFVNFIWTLAKKYERIDDVIFFGPSHLDNPIDPFGDPEELPLQRSSKMLAIVKAANEGAKGQDPFWDNSAEKLFLNLFILHEEVRKDEPDVSGKMSFTLLNLLLTDKGMALNAGEIQAYEAKRNEYFQQFDRASKELSSQIIEMIPDLERTSRNILALQSEIERDPNAKAEMRVAVASLKRLFEGIRSSQMVEIEGEMMSMEVEGGRFIMQLQSIKTAATQYTISTDDRERLHFEHTLVRSGADFRDMVYDRLGSLNVELLGEKNYMNLKNFARIYDDVLNAYDTLAKLRRPEEQIGALTKLLNTYQKILVKRGAKPEDDPIYTYFKNEFLNIANDKTAGSIAMVCTNMCNKMIHPPFNYLFTPDGTWNWKEVIDEGKIVVMDMSRAMYTAAAEIAYILMKTDYFRCVLGRKTLSVPDRKTGQPRKMNFDRELVYMVDEFQVAVSTGKETGEAGFLDRAREYKGTCVLATQGNSMLLKTVSREEMLAIYTNAQIKIFFANDEPETSKYLVDIGGLASWVNGSFARTAEQQYLNSRDMGDQGVSYNVAISQKYHQGSLAELQNAEAILKLPSRFGKNVFLKSKLELELLIDENAHVPVPRVTTPVRKSAEQVAVEEGVVPPAQMNQLVAATTGA